MEQPRPPTPDASAQTRSTSKSHQQQRSACALPCIYRPQYRKPTDHESQHVRTDRQYREHAEPKESDHLEPHDAVDCLEKLPAIHLRRSTTHKNGIFVPFPVWLGRAGPNERPQNESGDIPGPLPKSLTSRSGATLEFAQEHEYCEDSSRVST